jgi:hypothetical protein
MIINTQLLTNEMLNDMQEEAGEMGLTGNIYVDARGASPKERDEIRRILAEHYDALRTALQTVGSHWG